MDGYSGSRWCPSWSRRAPSLVILGRFGSGPVRAAIVTFGRNAGGKRALRGERGPPRWLLRVPNPFQGAMEPQRTASNFLGFRCYLRPVLMLVGASCGPVRSRQISSRLGLQGRTGRFRPVWACSGAWRAGNGHSGAQRWLSGVPRPIRGATEPQQGASFFPPGFWC